MIGVVFFIGVVFLWLVYRTNRAIIKAQNLIFIRLDRLERERSLVSGQTWLAIIKRPGMGKPTRRELVASSESDAVRQLVAEGIAGEHIMSLSLLPGGSGSGHSVG